MREITKTMTGIFNAMLNIRNEEQRLLKLIYSINLSPGQKILDVGCGYGKKMELLSLHGFELTGVDVNLDIIKTNREAGLNCMTVQEFNRTEDLYDVLLMSHVIEHFQPSDLLTFMDAHLNRLKIGGHLIIATPLNSPYFYEDFDHVKPYHPTGINMVFCSKNDQVQHCSQNKIELLDIWFRKGPYKLIFSPGLYLSKYNKFPFLMNVGFAILFRLSFGMIGKTDGWMGLYRKVQV